MKTKSSFILGVVSLMVLFAFNSCDDDNDSLDSFRIELATVNPVSEGGNSFYLTRDDKKTLVPMNSVNYKPKDNQRVYLNYTILSDAYDGYDHAIRINQMFNVLTKEVPAISTKQENDSIGNDRIHVSSAWLGDDYINVEFGYKFFNEVHFINLIDNQLADYEDDGKVHLEFRHNAYRDSQAQWGYGWAAFNIRPYLKEYKDEDKITFVIHYTNLNGDTKKHEIEYKKTDVNTSAAQINRGISTSLDYE